MRQEGIQPLRQVLTPSQDGEDPIGRLSREPQVLQINDKWKDGTAVLVLSHPDDEALFWGVVELLVQAGIPIHVIFMTVGELGKPDRDEFKNMTTSDFAKYRGEEMKAAMRHLDATYDVLNIPDYHYPLSSDPKLTQRACDQTSEIMGQIKPGVVFTFHHQEVTTLFDHRQHREAGMIAGFAGGKTDIPGISRGPVMKWRPDMFYWTTDTTKYTHYLELTGPARERRNTHLYTCHDSQFPKSQEQGEEGWLQKFDAITGGFPNHPGRCFELYKHVKR